METLEEQRVCVKFCFKLGKNSSETFKLLKQAFEDDVLSRTICFEWFKRFKEDRSSTKDNVVDHRPVKQMKLLLVSKYVSTESIQNNTKFKTPKVVVIGGGFSGLSATKHLICNGIKDVTILVGGRLKSKWITDTIVELGARKNNFQCAEQSTATSFVYLNNRFNWLENEYLKNIMTLNDLEGMSTVSIVRTMEAVDNTLKSIDTIRSLNENKTYGNMATVAGVRLKNIIQSFPLNDRINVAKLFTGVVNAYLNGKAIPKYYTNEVDLFTEIDDSNIRVPVGFQGSIVPYFDYIQPENVLLESPVSKIVWGCTGTNDPNAVVKTQFGKEYTADYFILAIPLGVLKAKVHDMFIPSLSREKLAAIEKLDNLHVNKVYFSYNVPLYSWYENELFNMESLGWARDVKTIQKVPGSDYVLEATVVGQGAKFMEDLTDEQVMNVMNDFVAEGHPNLKGSLPSIIQMVRSNWSSDQFFYGGMVESNIEIQREILKAEPATEEIRSILYFAGDYTCPGLSSSVKSAKISGVREAENILKYTKQTNQTKHKH
ncbi:protein anon-37Cs-like [Daktulosphaira vitifoliae]|uniref:protein anon-37Cs-like n=1 Tax=Daktulosphaira vitifoliae TaxID=58002 RepID=UPI0021AA3483|nr:protein anon-37Cs-like [Daktulosphaira vitifoliae]